MKATVNAKKRRGSMKKLYEVIGSFIPEEQKADVEPKINSELEKIVKEGIDKEKRSLSESYGIDFFETNVEKATAFRNELETKNKELLERNKELENSFKTFEEEKNNLLRDNQYNRASLGLLKEGFNPNRLEAVKPLLEGDGEIDEKVANIKNNFPELFLKGETFPSRTKPKEEEEKKTLTGVEQYIQQRKKQRK